MFSTAETYHAGLMSGSTHYTDLSTVKTLRIVGINQDTIETVVYDANGNYQDAIRTNSGDGTVPTYSAKNNNTIKPVRTVAAGHTALVKSSTTLSYVKDFIKGNILTARTSEPMKNERGWLMGFDNKRISVQISGAEDISIFTSDGKPIAERNAALYIDNKDGTSEQIGTTWILGGGTKDYYLHDGSYIFSVGSAATKFKVEYSNSGYYEKVLTFDELDESPVVLTVGDYSSKDVSCQKLSTTTESLIRTFLSQRSMAMSS